MGMAEGSPVTSVQLGGGSPQALPLIRHCLCGFFPISGSSFPEVELEKLDSSFFTYMYILKF